MAHNILLESGTNEVEILEFHLDGTQFGLNVSKVLQLVTFQGKDLTAIPERPSGLMGMLRWRELEVPLFDLREILFHEKFVPEDRSLVIVTEFNGMQNAFLTDGVNRIHRVGWDKITPAGDFLSGFSSKVIATITIEKSDIQLLDFEFIIAQIFPQTQLGADSAELDALGESRSRGEVTILFAEDSHFIQEKALWQLGKAGYTHVIATDDGRAALDKLLEMHSKGEKVDLLLTDIEMPRMDGLTLCKHVRDEGHFAKLPVVFFSSLINEQMIEKCKSVGGTDWVSKPDIAGIVRRLDNLTGALGNEL